jgi:hypothetical protein
LKEYMEYAKNKNWWNAARDRVKEVIEGPDRDIDQIIRSILENENKISANLQEQFPLLRDPQIIKGVENAVASKRTQRLPRAW